MPSQRHSRQRRLHPAEDLAHLAGHADANGVGDRNLERCALGSLAREFDDPRRRHLSLERAAEGGRYGDLRADAGRLRGSGDRAPGAERLGAGDTLVALIEGVGRENDHADFLAAGRRGAIETRAIEHEADVAQVRSALQRLQPASARPFGTRFGLTKLATSMRRMPASTARRMNSTLVAVETAAASFCRPSRGPTSTIPMLRGAVMAPDYSKARSFAPRPLQQVLRVALSRPG
jgi:hypothetical protein